MLLHGVRNGVYPLLYSLLTIILRGFVARSWGMSGFSVLLCQCKFPILLHGVRNGVSFVELTSRSNPEEFDSQEAGECQVFRYCCVSVSLAINRKAALIS